MRDFQGVARPTGMYFGIGGFGLLLKGAIPEENGNLGMDLAKLRGVMD